MSPSVPVRPSTGSGRTGVRRLAAAALLVAGALTIGTAAAGDHGDDDLRRDGPPPPAYVKECGACHVAYPPRLLPADAWRGLFAGLARHFGEDASLEPAVRGALEGWAVAHAGGDRGAGVTPPLRVTESRGFLSEHDELPRNVAARPSIRSLANCSACHPGAERWDFDEHGVRIPRR